MSYQSTHRHGIGGAEIAAVVGIDPYRSRMDVYEAKVGEIPEEEPQSWHIDRGNFLEDGALQWLAKRTEIPFHKPDDPLQHAEHSFCIATPDGVDRLVQAEDSTPAHSAVAEIKCPSPFAGMDWGEDGTGADGVPKRHIPQITWEMGAAQVKEAYVGALIGGFLRVYRMDFNPELFAALIDAAEGFMRCVKNRTPPAIDGGTPGEDWLKRKFPEHRKDRNLATAGPEQEELVEQYRDAYLLAKEYDAKKKALANQIKQQLGDDPGIEGRFGKILWKTSKEKQTTQWKEYAAHLAKVAKLSSADWEQGIADFTMTVPGVRPFRPYWKKEG